MCSQGTRLNHRDHFEAPSPALNAGAGEWKQATPGAQSARPGSPSEPGVSTRRWDDTVRPPRGSEAWRWHQSLRYGADGEPGAPARLPRRTRVLEAVRLEEAL